MSILLSADIREKNMSMEPIYPITALQKKTAEVKAAAQEDVVRITENGAGAYIFATEEVYEQKIQEAVEEAVYIARIADAIERGRADIAAGRYIEGSDAAWAEIERRAAAYAHA